MPKPLKIIGYWTSDRFKNDYYYKRYPNPKDWVDENWDNEIQKCDECNYFKTDKQAQKYKKESEE